MIAARSFDGRHQRGQWLGLGEAVVVPHNDEGCYGESATGHKLAALHDRDDIVGFGIAGAWAAASTSHIGVASSSSPQAPIARHSDTETTQQAPALARMNIESA